MSPNTVELIVIAAWIALMVASFFLFYVNKNVRFKKKWFPRFVVLIGVLFIAFVVWMGAPLAVLFFMVPVIALTFLNIRMTSFFDNCGRTITNQMFFSKPEYCAKCGAKLND